MLRGIRTGSATVYIVGHGAWAPKQGYTNVPAKTSITFYTQNAKLMPQEDAPKIMQGTYTKDPDCVIKEFHTSPNMTLYEASVGELTPLYNALPADQGLIQWNDEAGQDRISLADIFKALPGKKFIWLPCRNMELTKTTRGVQSGVNAGEFETEYYFFDQGGHMVPKAK